MNSGGSWHALGRRKSMSAQISAHIHPCGPSIRPAQNCARLPEPSVFSPRHPKRLEVSGEFRVIRVIGIIRVIRVIRVFGNYDWSSSSSSLSLSSSSQNYLNEKIFTLGKMRKASMKWAFLEKSPRWNRGFLTSRKGGKNTLILTKEHDEAGGRTCWRKRK